MIIPKKMYFLTTEKTIFNNYKLEEIKEEYMKYPYWEQVCGHHPMNKFFNNTVQLREPLDFDRLFFYKLFQCEEDLKALHFLKKRSQKTVNLKILVK
jgi:hypothetical protein